MFSDDFGLMEFAVKSEKERVRLYRKYVYETGAVVPADKPYAKAIGKKLSEKVQKRNFEISRADRFRQRTRYFTDSGAIGSREFVASIFRQFKHLFQSRNKKKPKGVKRLDGMFSLKRLSEII